MPREIRAVLEAQGDDYVSRAWFVSGVSGGAGATWFCALMRFAGEDAWTVRWRFRWGDEPGRIYELRATVRQGRSHEEAEQACVEKIERMADHVRGHFAPLADNDCVEIRSSDTEVITAKLLEHAWWNVAETHQGHA